MRTALVLLLLLPASAGAQTAPLTAPKDAYAAIVVGNLADYVSTEIALQRPGTREANPLGQTGPRRIVLKSVGTTAQLLMVRAFGKRSPRTARVVGWTAGIFLTSVAAAHNLQQGRR